MVCHREIYEKIIADRNSKLKSPSSNYLITVESSGFREKNDYELLKDLLKKEILSTQDTQEI